MLWNAMEASLLALTVALACRLLKLRAPLRHTLWLLVVIKLFVPPLAVHSYGLSSGFLRAVQAVPPFVSWELGRQETALPAPSSESTDLVGEPDPLAIDVFMTSPDMANLPEEPGSDSSTAQFDLSESTAKTFSGSATAAEPPLVQEPAATLESH